MGSAAAENEIETINVVIVPESSIYLDEATNERLQETMNHNTNDYVFCGSRILLLVPLSDKPIFKFATTVTSGHQGGEIHVTVL